MFPPIQHAINLSAHDRRFDDITVECGLEQDGAQKAFRTLFTFGYVHTYGFL